MQSSMCSRACLRVDIGRGHRVCGEEALHVVARLGRAEAARARHKVRAHLSGEFRLHLVPMRLDEFPGLVAVLRNLQGRCRIGWPSPGCALCRDGVFESALQQIRIREIDQLAQCDLLQARDRSMSRRSFCSLSKSAASPFSAAMRKRGLAKGGIDRSRIGEILIRDLARLRNKFGIFPPKPSKREEAARAARAYSVSRRPRRSELGILGGKVAANPRGRARRAPLWLKPPRRQCTPSVEGARRARRRWGRI